MILQLLRQFLNNLNRCSASFCFGLSLRFTCPLPKRISSRILSKSMFIPQNHPESQQRVRTCAVKEKPVFRALLALSMLEHALGTRLGPGRHPCWTWFLDEKCFVNPPFVLALLSIKIAALTSFLFLFIPYYYLFATNLLFPEIKGMILLLNTNL